MECVTAFLTSLIQGSCMHELYVVSSSLSSIVLLRQSLLGSVILVILSPLRGAKSQKHVILVGLKHNEETDMFSSHAAACCPLQVSTSC